MAKKFRFTLETVLRVRKLKEEQVQREYGTLLELRAREFRALAKLERDLTSMNEGQAAGRGEKMSVAMMALYENSRGALVVQIGWQAQRLKEAEEVLEVKRLELVAASRDRKVIEKLEESQFQAYLEKLNREEQAFLDELARYSGPASVNNLATQSPA